MHITIPPSYRTKRHLVAVDRSEWMQYQKHLRELRRVRHVVAEGDRALRSGRTRTVRSLRDLL